MRQQKTICICLPILRLPKIPTYEKIARLTAGKTLLFLALAWGSVNTVPAFAGKNFFRFEKTPFSDSTKKDSFKYETVKGLPLKPQRNISLTTDEGTWTSLDVSPDGKTIAFDMMGDIYTMPITGGQATQVTKGIAFDSHPRYSPDGKKLLFSSDRSGSENLWWIDFEKKDTFQLTHEHDQNFPSSCWTPDGDYIVYSKGN